MYKCEIENVNGEILTLTQAETDYQILSIDGLNPPSAQINTSAFASLDGAKFNSAKLGTRNIVIKLRLNGDVEANRLKLYRYFVTKQWCKFYYTNSSRQVSIECYVESVACAMFSKSEIMQVSLICPEPYFKGAFDVISDISKEQSMMEFPFSFGSIGATNPNVDINPNSDAAKEFSSLDLQRITTIYNDSENEVGAIITIDVSGSVNKILIRNVVTGETFTLNYNFVNNDKVIVNTNRGSKSVRLIRDGESTNLFAMVANNSIFFELAMGDNHFGYLADDGVNDALVHIQFTHSTLYRGI